jgi:excisionase family DNA binding protein
MEAQEQTMRPANATIKQAAAYLQVSDRTIQNFEYRGLLKAVRLGRRRFYRWSELERLARHGTSSRTAANLQSFNSGAHA